MRQFFLFSYVLIICFILIPTLSYTDTEPNFSTFNPPRYGNSKFSVLTRTGPSIKSQPALWIPKGDALLILGLKSDWLKIKIKEDTIVWIEASYVNMDQSTLQLISTQTNNYLSP